MGKRENNILCFLRMPKSREYAQLFFSKEICFQFINCLDFTVSPITNKPSLSKLVLFTSINT